MGIVSLAKAEFLRLDLLAWFSMQNAPQNTLSYNGSTGKSQELSTKAVK
jgi:hypothetical protein